MKWRGKNNNKNNNKNNDRPYRSKKCRRKIIRIMIDRIDQWNQEERIIIRIIMIERIDQWNQEERENNKNEDRTHRSIESREKKDE